MRRASAGGWRGIAGLVLAILVSSSGVGRGDSITLDDGVVVQGRVLEQSPVAVVIHVYNSGHPEARRGRTTIARRSIRSIDIAPVRTSYDGVLRDLRGSASALARVRALEGATPDLVRLAQLVARSGSASDDATWPAGEWRAACAANPQLDPGCRALLTGTATPGGADLGSVLAGLGVADPERVAACYAVAAREEPGVATEVPLTVRAARFPGGSYCRVLPRRLGETLPLPLVIALHGGGVGGSQQDTVYGTGRDLLDRLAGTARRLGILLVCPSALEGPWTSATNQALLDAVLEEVLLLHPVDLDRIYVLGESMGAAGAWLWAAHCPRPLAGLASIALCASVEPASGAHRVPGIYLAHGRGDRRCRPGASRDIAAALRDAGHDFVYTELPAGHEMPGSVFDEALAFLVERHLPAAGTRPAGPRNSLLQPPREAEDEAFALRRVRDLSALPADALITAMDRAGWTARAAARELARRQDPRAATALARLALRQEAPADARFYAIEALGAQTTLPGALDVGALLREEPGPHGAWIVAAAAPLAARQGAAARAEAVAAIRRWLDAYDAWVGPENLVHGGDYLRVGRVVQALVDALLATGPEGDAEVGNSLGARLLDGFVAERGTWYAPPSQLAEMRSMQVRLARTVLRWCEAAGSDVALVQRLRGHVQRLASR